MQLKTLNYYAAMLHAFSAVGVGAVFYFLEPSLKFNTNLYGYKVTGDTNNINIEYYEVAEITIQLLEGLIAGIFLITGIFHTFYATDGFDSGLYSRELKKGYNRFRWLEYSITSTMMIFVLSLMSGIKDYQIIYELCVLNIMLMSLGYFLERGVNKEVKYIALALGFGLLITIFTTLLINFYSIIEENNLPNWLNYVLIPMLIWWLSFGIVAFANVMNQDKQNYDFVYYEKCYIFLSYFSKANMGYYITYGLVTS